jgi:biopolymer transport protein ExbB
MNACLRWMRLCGCGFALALVAIGFTMPLLAQRDLLEESAPGGAAAPANPPGNNAAANPTPGATDPNTVLRIEESFFSRMVRTSGIFGFLILLVGLVMVFLIFIDVLELRRENYLPDPFLEHFERLLEERNYQAAYEAARTNDSFIGRVLAGGMARLNGGYDDVLQGMQETGDEEALAMEHSIGYLGLIATVAPMIGLLGTVYGMALSYHQVVSVSSLTVRPYDLGDGIAMALFTTLEGIAVAIPAVIAHSLLRNRLAKFVMEAGHVGEQLLRRFQGIGRTSAIAPPAPRWSSATVATVSSVGAEG